jgi:polyisoprenoid-binding protein YceI
MKIFIGVVVVIVVGAIALLVFSPKPSEDLDRAQITDIQETNEMEQGTDEAVIPGDDASIAKENVTFAFTGFGPGKKHVGTFDDYTISNVAFGIQEGDTNIVPTSGTIVFKSASVNADTAILNGPDGHLCAEGFFDCTNYPDITFSIVSVEKINETDYNLTGNLTIKGITKQITVPASYAKGFAQSNFAVDMTQFNFSGPTVNPEVEIAISAVLN